MTYQTPAQLRGDETVPVSGLSSSVGSERVQASVDEKNSPPPALRLSGISKTYPGTDYPAVSNLSLTVRDGEIMTLLGPSGCGKTTTLRMVAGLEYPDEGEIYFGSEAVVLSSRGLFVPPNKRNVGMVFQSYAIWPHMTVAQNVAFPLKSRGFPRRKIKDRVREALELVGMGGFEDRPGPLLSGGQQQRVAFARALASHPRTILLDEPFSNLDAKLREQMRIYVKMLQKRLNLAFLFVTHDQQEALSLSTRIAVMQNGVVQQEGPPFQLYERPANQFVRDFIGKTLLLRGSILTVDTPHRLTISLDGSERCVVKGRSYNEEHVKPGDQVYIGVRPEDIHIIRDTTGSPPEGSLPGIVDAALFMGERIEYQVNVDGQHEIMIFGDRHDPIPEGANVWLKLRGEGHTAWLSDLLLSEEDETLHLGE